MLTRIAFRNIFRNRRRTLITGMVLVFGVVAMMMFGGYKEINFWGIREGAARARFGHLQIYAEGYAQADSQRPLARGLRNIGGLRREIESDPRVEMTAAQISMMGLISNGDKSEAFLATAVEPALDRKMPAQRMIAGSFLNDSDADSVVVGEALAKSMKAGVGDTLTLMTTTANGSLNALDVRVAGVFSTGMKEYDERAIKIPLSSAQRLLQTDKIEKLLVVLRNTDDTEAVKRDLEARFARHGQRFEMRTWSELAGFYHQVVMLYNGIFGFLGAVIAVIVVLSVANTILMSAFERTREIGTLMAIGTERSRIWNIFLLEGLLLGVLGGLAGLALGGCLALVINHVHIELPPPPGYTSGYRLQIMLNATIVISAFLLAACTATISSVVPAFKASRLRIVDALGHI
jgi:putative ABC transport system permease protein